MKNKEIGYIFDLRIVLEHDDDLCEDDFKKRANRFVKMIGHIPQIYFSDEYNDDGHGHTNMLCKEMGWK